MKNYPQATTVHTNVTQPFTQSHNCSTKGKCSRTCDEGAMFVAEMFHERVVGVRELVEKVPRWKSSVRQMNLTDGERYV